MPPPSKLQELVESDPDAAAKLLLELQQKVIIPHDGGQREILEDTTRFQIVCCGRRFGKTVVGAKKALLRCRQPNQMVWWLAPTYKVVKRGYAEVLRQLPDNVLTKPPPAEQSFDAGRTVILHFKNGSKMEFYSAERPEGMLGQGVDYVVLDEAATMPKHVWETTVRPTLMDREGHALMISTPRGRNWFYYVWLRGQDAEKPLYKSWKFPTNSNPFISEEEVREMADSMPLVTYQQEVQADFISTAGSVFRFHDDIVVKKVKAHGRVVVGVDLAKSQDFTVFSAASVEDMLPCGYDRFNEIAWKMQRSRLREFVRNLIAEGATHVTLMIDSGGPGDPIVEEMEGDGYDVVPINFTKFKQNMVVQLAKDMEQGVVRLDYEEPLHEFENYTYKITDAGKWTYSAPEGQHDDAVSAKMLQHWGIVQEGAPNITAIAADDSVSQDEERKETEAEDFADIWEESVDTGIPTETVIEADPIEMLMGRRAAWTGSEHGLI